MYRAGGAGNLRSPRSSIETHGRYLKGIPGGPDRPVDLERPPWRAAFKPSGGNEPPIVARQGRRLSRVHKSPANRRRKTG